MKKPLKICNQCRKPKKEGCVECKPKAFENISKTNYKLYNSTKWRKYAHSLRREEPLCRLCLKEGITKASEMVDHIRPINKGGSIWNRDNLQCLCHKCHNKKTSKDK